MEIFICRLCKEDYNEFKRKPLSLPCGHVYCEECIEYSKRKNKYTFTCPSDGISHKIETVNFPVCAQILSNLPNKNYIQPRRGGDKSKGICCLRHKDKEIKFFCKDDDKFPCTICFNDHKNHSVVVYNVNKRKFEEEIAYLDMYLEKEKEKCVVKMIKIEEEQRKMNEFFKKQFNQIEKYYDKLIAVLYSKKDDFIYELKSSYDEKKKIYDMIKNESIKLNEMFSHLKSQVNSIKCELIPKGDYEVFYNMKKTMIDELQKNINIIVNSNFNMNELPKYIEGNYLNNLDKRELTGYITHNLDTKRITQNPMNIKEHNDKQKQSEKIIDNNNNDNYKDTLASFSFLNENNDIFKQNLLNSRLREIELTSRGEKKKEKDKSNNTPKSAMIKKEFPYKEKANNQREICTLNNNQITPQPNKFRKQKVTSVEQNAHQLKNISPFSRVPNNLCINYKESRNKGNNMFNCYGNNISLKKNNNISFINIQTERKETSLEVKPKYSNIIYKTDENNANLNPMSNKKESKIHQMFFPINQTKKKKENKLQPSSYRIESESPLNC